MIPKLPSLKIILGLDKVENFVRMVKQNGGIKQSLYKTFRNDYLKEGTLVGEDKYGNKYYENDNYFVGRNRWVDYNDNVYLNYNASQIPPEWHRWLQHICDLPPTVDRPVHHKWMIDHQENQTGTKFAYMPYSTTKQKIQPWIAENSKNRRLAAQTSQS